MKPKAVARKAIPRTEWDFSLCPLDEISFCCSYEYLREVAAVERARIGDKWTVLNFEAAFDRYFKDGKLHYYKGVSDGKGDPFEINLAPRRGIGQIVSKCSGFPDRPFLQLQPAERKAWLKEFRLDELRYDRPTMATGIRRRPRALHFSFKSTSSPVFRSFSAR